MSQAPRAGTRSDSRERLGGAARTLPLTPLLFSHRASRQRTHLFRQSPLQRFREVGHLGLVRRRRARPLPRRPAHPPSVVPRTKDSHPLAALARSRRELSSLDSLMRFSARGTRGSDTGRAALRLRWEHDTRMLVSRCGHGAIAGLAGYRRFRRAATTTTSRRSTRDGVDALREAKDKFLEQVAVQLLTKVSFLTELTQAEKDEYIATTIEDLRTRLRGWPPEPARSNVSLASPVTPFALDAHCDARRTPPQAAAH